VAGIAVVTGASRGIGRACALMLARDGFEVWANYRSREDEAKKLEAEITAAGGVCKLIPFDVADRAAAQAALAPLESKGAAVLVNNAGIAKDGLFMNMPGEDWDVVLQTNLGAFYNVTRPVLKGMAMARAGRIITISSVSGEHGNKGQTNYAAAKAGLIAAAKSLALEYGRWNILSNVVSPGFVATDMVASLPVKELEKQIPLRRFGTPDEVAGVVSFLASEKASYMTGAVLCVNGGLYT
jgi:3-oxoacyl-[acyl-carrier protein] reductase